MITKVVSGLTSFSLTLGLFTFIVTAIFYAVMSDTYVDDDWEFVKFLNPKVCRWIIVTAAIVTILSFALKAFIWSYTGEGPCCGR